MKISTAAGLVAVLGVALAPGGVRGDDDIPEVVLRLMETPALAAQAGFSVAVLVPPGTFYDPLFVVPRSSDRFWINDDGGEDEDRGGSLWEVNLAGETRVLAPVGGLLPLIGFGVAPAGFGQYGGQIFALTQPAVAVPGALANHLIQRIDPANDFSMTRFCELPSAGTVAKALRAAYPALPEGVSGMGVDATFGAEGTAFANQFFAITHSNDAIYRVNADGTCEAFVILRGGDQPGSPFAFAFVPAGYGRLEGHMLVSTANGNLFRAEPLAGVGTITAITGAGKIVEKPFAEGFTSPGGMAFAPAGFGAYGGQLFVADAGVAQYPVPQTQQLQRDGKIYRVTKDGKKHLVARGFVNPFGLRFVGNSLIVSDINGDFIAGGRELPDGFVVVIRAP